MENTVYILGLCVGRCLVLESSDPESWYFLYFLLLVLVLLTLELAVDSCIA